MPDPGTWQAWYWHGGRWECIATGKTLALVSRALDEELSRRGLNVPRTANRHCCLTGHGGPPQERGVKRG